MAKKKSSKKEKIKIPTDPNGVSGHDVQLKKIKEVKKEPLLAPEEQNEIISGVKEETKEAEVKKLRIDKELYWILGVMLGLILVFFVSTSVFKSLNKIDYEGLTFTKEKFGEIPVYHYSYYYNNPGKVTGSAIQEGLVQYNLFLRKDPRKNEVPVDGEIFLQAGKTTYVSVDPVGLVGCEYSSVAISNLVSFLVDNLVPVKGASPNATLAEEVGAVYATCETHPDNTVIIVQGGEDTKVYKENNRCYVIQAADCEALDATEKFVLQSIIDARKRKTSQVSETQV